MPAQMGRATALGSYTRPAQIAEGRSAAAAFSRSIAPDTPDDERIRIRGSLLSYCKRDTEAMVRVYDALVAEANGVEANTN